MHVLILSKRNGEAQARLLRSAAALAEYFELDPSLVAALQQTDKDVAVRALKEREAVADLFQALAIQVGALQESAPEEVAAVTAVTEEETMGGMKISIEGLPPPVLDAGGEAAVDQVVEPEATGEDVPTEEEVPAEEVIAAKPKPAPRAQSSKSKSTRAKKR